MIENLITREEFDIKVNTLIETNDGPFSVAIVDIDNFSRLNNDYGRDMGDEALRKITSILKQNLSPEDLLTKKGDEFTILLTKKGAERSLMQIEEIRTFLSENTFELSDGNETHNIYMTVSSGIASYPRDSKNSVELYRVADSAIFRAKNLGKNKVCLSEAESMVLKSSYFTKTQVDRLSILAKRLEKTEAFLLREALDDLFKKYSQ